MEPRHRRPVVAALMAVYLAALAVLVGGPWGEALNRFTVACYVQFRYVWPIAPRWMLPEHYGVLLNVVMFVPIGVALVAVARLSWVRATLLAAVGSAAIELVQGLFLVREATFSDIVANTLGALIGALAVLALITLRQRRRR